MFLLCSYARLLTRLSKPSSFLIFVGVTLCLLLYIYHLHSEVRRLDQQLAYVTARALLAQSDGESGEGEALGDGAPGEDAPDSPAASDDGPVIGAPICMAEVARVMAADVQKQKPPPAAELCAPPALPVLEPVPEEPEADVPPDAQEPVAVPQAAVSCEIQPVEDEAEGGLNVLDMKIDELRARVKAAGLDARGSKATLQDRLAAHLAGGPAAE